MSNTTIDFAKVTQMLDAGWQVQICKNDMGTYTAQADHPNIELWNRARAGVLKSVLASGVDGEAAEELVDADFDRPCFVDTDDFTPEQALTRLAYKIHGEVLR